MIYAKPYKRFVAMLIDFGLFFLIFTPITYLVKGVWIMSSTDHLWLISDPICILFLCLIIVYYIVCERFWGQTLGKRMMRIKVIPETGKPMLTIRQIALRLVLLFIDGFLLGLIGYIVISKSPQKQRIGDKAAKTIVVYGY